MISQLGILDGSSYYPLNNVSNIGGMNNQDQAHDRNIMALDNLLGVNIDYRNNDGMNRG
jgi:hypothetical protein